MREPSGCTTEDAYPKMFPVNSMHASAPRYTLRSAKKECQEDVDTYVVGRRYLALVDRHNRPGPRHHSSVAEEWGTT